MRASRRVLIVVIACLSSLVAAQSDQVVAERVLGPQWKQLSRRAGMIFAGTVLTAIAPTAAPDPAVSETIPAPPLSLRVDQAIAGVERGQVLTVHQWAGAWSMHRPLLRGQRILIFLYPLSRLGLTSPVGGSLGQFALDPGGNNVVQHGQNPAPPTLLRSESSPQPRVPVDPGSVSVVQLERAIRSAREE